MIINNSIKSLNNRYIKDQYKKAIGKYFYNHRKEKNMTILDLSKYLNLCRSSYIKRENGLVSFTTIEILLLLQLYNIKIKDYLIYLTLLHGNLIG